VRRTLQLCLEKDARKRLADMSDVKLALAGAFEPERPAAPLWRRALPFAATLVVGLLLASVYFVSARPPPAPAAAMAPAPVSRFVITPPATAPLANQGGVDLTISPDGRRIAYLGADPASGKVGLYVRELDALEARAIPGTEGADFGTWNPFFSPDGKSVGFATADRGLVSVGLDGQPPVKIADARGSLGSWWAGDNTIIHAAGSTLFRVPVSGGGTPEPLMPRREGGGVAGPVLLPGGHAVLFHAFDATRVRDSVAVLDLDTGQEKTVIEGGSNPAYVDTGHLVFARGDTLMAVPFNVSELAVTGEPVALVQGVRRDSGGAADYAVSVSGTLAYVPAATEATSETAIVWVDRAGKITGRAVPEPVYNPRDPKISPDGKRLLLVTGQEYDGDLWNYDLSGRPPIPLVLPGNNNSPVWSPDGKQVAFRQLGNGTSAGGMMTLAADGSERTPRPLPEAWAQRVAPLAWTAAGEWILLSYANNGDIASVAVGATGEPRAIVASDSRELGAALSPNGRWLAYVSNRTGQNEIWVQAYPQGPPVRVSSNTGYEPLWSADGRELFYRQGNAVVAVAVETGAEFSFATPKVLFSGAYVQRTFDRAYDVAPDGRFLMMLQGDEKTAPAPASIVVVENFAEELKRRVPASK
jgi:Tol biopolymer transport system component